MSDHPTMHWSRSDLLATISGSGTIENFWLLSIGEFVSIEVDHASEELAWATAPALSSAEGASMLLDCSRTDESGFCILAMVVGPPPEGYDAHPNLDYTWQRTGGKA